MIESKRQKKKDLHLGKNLSLDFIKEKYFSYLNTKIKYPKSQFCFFYFKGFCLLPKEKCQFAHGFEDLNYSDFLLFVKDKNAFENENQKKLQKEYFYRFISTIQEFFYVNLFEFQNEHKNLFQKIFTKEEIQNNRENRVIIRNEMNKDILTKLLKFLFDKKEIYLTNELNEIIVNVGYPYSIKNYTLNEEIFFCKNISIKKNQNKNVKLNYSIKFLSFEKILQIYVDFIINSIKNDEKFTKNFFPFTFIKLNNFINRNFSNEFVPSIFHTTQKFNLTNEEFCNKICEFLLNEDSIKKCDFFKNKNINDIFLNVSNENLINFISNELFNRNKTKNNIEFGFVNHSKIFELFNDEIHYVYKNGKEKNINVDLIFNLFQKNTLIFIDNSNIFYYLNLNFFDNFDIEFYFNSNYFKKNCQMPNKENLLIKKLNEIIYNKNNNKKENLNDFPIIKEEQIKNNILNVYELKVFYINNFESLCYFYQQSKNFSFISIDLEGRLSTSTPFINLIQINDDLNKNIFIIDVFLFTNDKNLCMKYFNKLKIILKSVFENKNINKIFFDGRNDLNSLFFEFDIKIKNYIDLSSFYSALKFFNEELNFKLKNNKNSNDFENLMKINKHDNIFKGINNVLQEFHPQKKTNQLKQKFHKLFTVKEKNILFIRPIEKDLLYYAALDVVYLYDTFINMKNKLKNILEKFYENKIVLNDDNLYVIIQIICSGHLIDCIKNLNIN